MINKIVFTSSFLFKHLIALTVSVVAPIILWVITYFVLFVIAIFTNSRLGSPVALPLWALIIFLLSVLYTVILLFPSVVLAETIARIFGKWQHIAQIPISTLFLAVLVFVTSSLVRIFFYDSVINFLYWVDYPIIIFLGLTIPLGIYWWSMKIAQTGLLIPKMFFKRLRKTQIPEDSE